MLNTSTKKRIDDCRDILVGKLPDPKAQIEQITIALIYKFMDDMDKEAVELGGKPKFFADYTIPDPENPKKKKKIEFEKFAWDNLFDPKVSAAQMLALYAEAITLMDKNPNIPQLFRDIFKNAFLPYRDPETLKLFLKEIGKFEYTHSEKLGDAFEYLLAVMGSQGDAGQFRTPRHIIDFLVSIVDPDIMDTILDPACGTAGFLISAYKHIRLKHSKSNKDKLNIYQFDNNYADTEKPFNDLGDSLTPDNRKRLIKNISGYDISPDMVRLSLVNLYLHGFSDPHIHEYDTLSSEDRWDEHYDVILANPPFMSPKGGIRPHNKFSISSNRSEVLFVDYIAEHLNPKGRAGIIVPEGIIFQSGTAYKALRKMLVENYLYAVVSLPAGVFNPYSGVKTSILLMDKEFAKKSEEILFVKIENDGYNLGAQRNSVKGGQLEEAIEIIKNFREGTFKESSLAHAVPKAEIAKNGDFNLSGERHKSKRPSLSNFELVKLSDERFFQILAGGTPSSENKEYWNGTINWATLVDLPANDFISNIYSTARKITEDGLKNSSAKLLPANSVIVSTRATIGRIAINRVECSTNQGFKNIVIKKFNKTNTVFVALMMTRLVDKMNQMATGVTFKELSATAFKTLQIPLPPLSVQEEIVAEIEGYQKIIDGAKMVVENYKPRIDIDPEWEMVELGEVITLQRGYDLPKQNWKKGEYPIVGSNGIIGFHENYKEKGPGVVTGRSGTIGKVHYIDYEYYWPHNTSLFVKDFKNNYPKFIKYLLETLDLKSLGERTSAVPSLDRKNAHKLKVFLPPIETQRQIVSQIEQEQQLVNANKQLIDLFEKKIKDRIAKVWGE